MVASLEASLQRSLSARDSVANGFKGVERSLTGLETKLRSLELTTNNVRFQMTLRQRGGRDDRQRLASVEERARRDFEEYMVNVKKLQDEVLTRERRLREMEAKEAAAAAELQRAHETVRAAEASARESEEALAARTAKLAADHEARVKDLTNEFLTSVEKHREGESKLRIQMETLERRLSTLAEEKAQAEQSLKAKLTRTKEKKKGLKTKSAQLADQIKDLLALMSLKDEEIRRVKDSLITGRLSAPANPALARPLEAQPRARREPILAEPTPAPPAPLVHPANANLGQMIDSLEKLAMDILKDDDF
eukprot:TRINITY_DN4768_c0_g1_i14.p1 TRINITY_DN4768_c0_g1~~TRINITY_DN4768_c0_g1_i14.p1  ORF type:complete len:308 (+),score=83.54 TRINITY_DN4768_c0_g1_i14:405-1328(+)